MTATKCRNRNNKQTTICVLKFILKTFHHIAYLLSQVKYFDFIAFDNKH